MSKRAPRRPLALGSIPVVLATAASTGLLDQLDPLDPLDALACGDTGVSDSTTRADGRTGISVREVIRRLAELGITFRCQDGKFCRYELQGSLPPLKRPFGPRTTSIEQAIALDCAKVLRPGEITAFPLDSV